MTHLTPPRPTANNEMRLRAPTALVEEMIKCGVYDLDGELPDLAADLANACRSSFGGNGYDIAKVLDERYGWSPTAEMVEHFDCMSSYVDKEVREAEKQWVEANQIKPEFATGDRVAAKHGADIVIGTIREVYDFMPACYAIVKDGGDGKSAAIVRFEDTKAA